MVDFTKAYYDENDGHTLWFDDDKFTISVNASAGGIYGTVSGDYFTAYWVIDESHNIDELYGEDLNNSERMTELGFHDMVYTLKEYGDLHSGDKIPKAAIKRLISMG